MSTRIGAILCAVLAISTPVVAKTSYLSDAKTAYPSITATRLDSCSLCHSSGSSRNSFGTAFGNAGHNIKAIENLDSDSDGITNLVEITDLTFPGNASDFPTGAVQVTITPAEAVSAGAQWRIAPSGTYQNSGATVAGLKIGDSVVQFKAVSGWTVPEDIPLTVLFGQTVSQSGVYTQQQVSVPNVVGMTQSAASTTLTGAGLILGTVMQVSSDTIPAGQIISQAPTAGSQVAPGASVNIVVSTGSQAVPVLSVLPLAREVGAGAGTTTFDVANLGSTGMMWTASIVAGGGWLTLTSGQEGTDAGTIVLSFAANTSDASRAGTVRVAASGATGSPADVTVTQAGQQTGGIGTLQVTVEPQGARDAGAEWSVDGGEWHDSGAEVILPVGQHTVSFKDVQNGAAKALFGDDALSKGHGIGCMGSMMKILLPNPDDGLKAASGGCAGNPTPQWATPADMNVTVIEGQTVSVTGTYTEAKKTLAANVAGSSSGDILVLLLAAAALVLVRRRKTQMCSCRIDQRKV